MDGTLGSQTALLLDGTGVRITSREELEELIRVGAQAHFPVAVHAIGDRANRDALDAFEATQDVWRPLGLRHRIEHAQCLAPEDVRASRSSASRRRCSSCTRLPTARSSSVSGRTARTARTGSARSGRAAPSSRTARTRRSKSSILSRASAAGLAWREEEALTLEQALQATCVTPAWLTYDERRRGKLLPGYLADLVVLSTDPFEDLAGCEVVATMTGGRWVHNAPPWE